MRAGNGVYAADVYAIGVSSNEKFIVWGHELFMMLSSHSLFSYYYFQSEMIIMNELRQHTYKHRRIMFYISITSSFD